jgi:hypothetical protein
MVSGNSDDNPQFNCKVLIIVNDKHPYQETIQALGENSREKGGDETVGGESEEWQVHIRWVIVLIDNPFSGLEHRSNPLDI